MLDKIVFACLLVLVFSIPFELDFGYMEVNLPWINTNLELIAVLTFLAWAVKKIKEKRFVSSPFDLLILLYIVCNLISTFGAENPVWAFKHTLKLTGGILLYYLVLDIVKENAQIEKIINVILISSFLVIIIGFIEKIFIYDLFEYSPFWVFSPTRHYIPGGYGLLRISATFVSPNILAMYLEIITLITTGLFLLKSSKHIFNMYLIVILLTALALIFTYSRAGLIGLFGSLGFMCILCAKKQNLKQKFNELLLLIVILVIFSGVTIKLDSTLVKRLKGTVDLSSNPAGQRFYLWKIALKTFKEHPVFGIGPDNFRWTYIEKYSHKSPYLKYNPPQVIPSINSNSIYFELISCLGILGTIVFIYLMIKIFLYLLRNLYSTDEYLLYISLGILGAFLSYFIHGIFDCFDSFQSIILLFWLITGLGVKIRQLNTDKTR